MTKVTTLTSNRALEGVIEDSVVIRCPTTLTTSSATVPGVASAAGVAAASSASMTEEPHKKKRQTQLPADEEQGEPSTTAQRKECKCP